MKKFFLMMAMALIGLSAWAGDTTGNAVIVRNAIKAHLTSEGYAPTIDDDGDIKFKVEGYNYYISCENWRDHVYIDTFRIMDIDDASVTAVRRCADEAQTSYKFVRCNIYEESVLVGIPVSVPGTNTSIFTDKLSIYISVIQDTIKKLKECYNG